MPGFKDFLRFLFFRGKRMTLLMNISSTNSWWSWPREQHPSNIYSSFISVFKSRNKTKCLVLLLLFKTLPLCLSVSWNVACSFCKVKFLCDASTLTVDKGICLWDAGRVLGRCLIFRQLKVLGVLALLQTRGLKVALKWLTDQSLPPLCWWLIIGGGSKAWDKIFGVLFFLVHFLPEDMIPRCLVSYKRCEAKVRQMLAAEGSPLRQRVHGTWPWLKIISLGGSGPASHCGPGQLSSTAIPPWHLAAGPKGAHHAGTPSTAKWTHNCLEGRKTKMHKGWKS